MQQQLAYCVLSRSAEALAACGWIASCGRRRWQADLDELGGPRMVDVDVDVDVGWAGKASAT